MRCNNGKKVASLCPLPIILLTRTQSPSSSAQADAALLWVFVVISMLLASASLGLTVIRTNKSNKRIKKLESSPGQKLSIDHIEAIVIRKTKTWVEELVNIRKKVESSNLEKRALNLEFNELNKRLNDLITQAQSKLPMALDPYAPSSNKVATDDSISTLLVDKVQLDKPAIPEPITSDQEMSVSNDQSVISEESRPDVNSRLIYFASAIEMGNSNLIREQSDSELNITKESEDALVRREAGHKTQLEEVNGGGSYHRLEEGDRSWLFPTPLTLKTIARNQPSKGLFRYEVQPILTPRIEKPTAIKPVSGNRWEVLEMGTIAVPMQDL